MFSPLISIEQAAIGYGNVPVFDSLTLEIKKGHHWAFIGESGSGKTTLLQLIAGNVQLKKGNIARHFKHSDNLRQQIAFVAAKHSFRNLSNTSDLYYQQRYNSSDSDDALTVSAYLESIETIKRFESYWTVDKAIHLLNLAPLADKQLIKLSNGETKRLLIAAALLKNPALLLLDSPLTGLDAKTRLEFDGILSAIMATGILHC